MTIMARTTVIIAVACVSSGVLVIAGLFGLAIYGRGSAIRAGNEAATQQHLMTIAAMEIQYYNTHLRTFGTFDQLIKEEMLTSRFSGTSPAVDGYVFKLNITHGTSSQPGLYTLNADPQSNTSGRNHFYIDSTSAVIRVNPDRPAGPSDPPPGQ